MGQSRAKGGISRTTLIVTILVIIVVAGVGIYYYATSALSTKTAPLILYCADAYVSEATFLENLFTSSSGVQMVAPRSGGSIALGQEIALGDPTSVFISVSRSAVSPSTLGGESSGWAIAFESDQMAITYSNATKLDSSATGVIASYQNALSANTIVSWFDFFSNLTSGAFRVGISNPNSDPAGYRAWIVLEAAGYLCAENNTNYFVKRMIQNQVNVTAASAADLIAPLEQGNIQFLFIYNSAGLAQKLDVLKLQSQINLGDPAYSSFYSKFSYATTTGSQAGGAISLFITVPKDSTDQTDSLAFVVFVVKNSASLNQFGLSPLSPAKLYNDSSVPQQIQQLISQGYLTQEANL